MPALQEYASATLPVHRLHDEEIERLLARGERRAELTALLGADGYRELSELARRASQVTPTGPRTYVLPGLMGSRIGRRGHRLDDVLWLDVVEAAAGHLARLALPQGDQLSVLGVMLLNVLKLKLSLTIAGFDARFHAYDWRRSILSLATDLNERIAQEGHREVLLVGHSMGGLVARAALAGDAGRVRRAVQIGSPNLGSFAPVLALRGVYPTVRKLAALDAHHDAEELARIVFRSLPALHELLPDPALVGGPDLFDEAAWPEGPLRPDPAMLASARQSRAKWPAPDDRCLHVVGIGQDTITSLRRRGRNFEYSFTREGDGTVPRMLAELAGARAWYADEIHGGLPNNGKVIEAAVDLLRMGTTERLPSTAARPRRPRQRVVTEPALRRVAPNKVHWQQLSPDARRRLLEPVVSPEFHGGVHPRTLAATRHALMAAATPVRTVELRLWRGDIVEANARALVLGVFRNVDPSGPALDVDQRLGGAIRDFTLRRMFSANPGEVFVLPATRSPLLADFVLFAGLGDFDELEPQTRAFVAENIVRTVSRSRAEDFATVLLGAGSGVPVAAAVEQQLSGFLDGLRHADPERVIRRITLCEINRRKYTELRRAVLALAPVLARDDLQLVVDESEALPVPPRPRRRRRAAAAAGTSEPAYLLVTMFERDRSTLESRCALLTAGAKAAVLSGVVRPASRRLAAQLVRIERGPVPAGSLPGFGAELAELLLPENVREGLLAMSSRPLVILHDFEASRVPWETLRIGALHPALAAGMSRRYASEHLSVARWREDGHRGEPERVLLVVNPTRDLPGAAAEGEELLPLLQASGAQVDCIEGGAATRARLLRELAAGRHDVMHFAGHGYFDPDDAGRSGLLCARDEVLRSADLGGIATLPSLVFFNACEAARVRRPGSRAARRLVSQRRSSSIAEAFLASGVANFVGTHWPVGDDAALSFSSAFYRSLLAGRTLGEAMLAARRKVHATGSPDWADYVHYGNPAFALDRADGSGDS